MAVSAGPLSGMLRPSPPLARGVLALLGAVVAVVGGRLAGRCGRRCYHSRMTTRAQLEKAVRDAEAELDAATTLTAVKAAAKKLQRAKAELKELKAAERPKRRA
jgi:hypothetical protein